MAPKAVAVFTTRSVQGDVIFSDRKNGLYIEAVFTKLPKGRHGFHIHKAGDLDPRTSKTGTKQVLSSTKLA